MTERPVREAALDWVPALRRHAKADLVSGFFVFLIALPLSLGIALASGFPAIAGVVTAVVGGVVVTFLSGAPLTIKGPAAGLIAIAVASVAELGEGDAMLGYRRTLAVIVCAGAVQIALGLLRAGRLGDFFPGSAVHGMLAAIGVIIMAKQIHVMLGVTPTAREPLGLLAEVPNSLAHMNPEIAAIGLLSLVILFGLPMIRHPLAKKIPAPMLVLLVAMPLGLCFDLDHQHTYSMIGETFVIGPRFLVDVPSNLASALVGPDFSMVGTATSMKFVAMFALVGTLESLLTVRAIDGLDPANGRSRYDRDIVAIGVGNTLCGLIGGLPMISEIVRSKANLDNGVKSRFANFFHGLFLLVFVALLPALVHEIPLAALGAMLVYTGARLASPNELVHAWKLGRDQIAVFVATLFVTLATDLLVGVAVGIVLEMALHVMHGARLTTLFRPLLEERDEDGARVLVLRSTATFASYLALKQRIRTRAREHERVVVDLSDAPLVDPTTQERLHDLALELHDLGMHLEVRGLDRHRALGALPNALRKLASRPIEAI
ncbi:MAG: SulP family inorganic anion transporter [Myxococcota bacterium]|nr:SulP family inorganic anion transporter [Myxococcota bacterium]